MKKFLVGSFLIVTTISQNAHAALFSLSGNHVFGSNWLYNLDVKDGHNQVSGKDVASDTTSFLEQRFLLRPDVLIDERFSLRSEISLMNQNNFDSVVSSVNQTNAGAQMDAVQGTKKPATQELKVRYAYLKWNSDMGVFRAGRMPKGWGLGLMYDEGSKAEDVASTIVDRLGFEGQLGSLVLNFAFEKYQEGTVYKDIDDDEVFEGSVKYVSESSGTSIGLLYARHIRLADSDARKSAAGYTSSNDFSFFAKKEWDDLTLGAEVASVAYDKQDDVYGALGQLRYSPGSWNFEFDGLFSSSSGGRGFIVHPNYRPFLILFRQNLAANVGTSTTRYGYGVGYDPASTTGTEDGALMGRLAAFYNFAQKKYKLGLVGGYAQLMSENSFGEKNLGIEADLVFDQQWYENFKTSVTTGVLLPGKAFGPSAKMAWGLQLRSYLSF